MGPPAGRRRGPFSDIINPVSDATGSPIRVLIADDHTLVREGTRELLSKDPLITVIAEAADGVEAVDLIERLHPDVAIVDITMPGLNGIEVTKRVKASRPDVAVLVLTVHDEDPYVMAVLQSGAAGYLLKTIQARDLIEAIRAVHSGRGALHPATTRAVFEHVRTHPLSGEGTTPLTGRESEVLRLAARGMSNKQIAHQLELSPRTIQTHLANVFKRLGASSRTEAVTNALREGLLDIVELS